MCTCLEQVNILKNEKKSNSTAQKHSRGVAFVDFQEHEHALVALRVLNNNPGTASIPNASKYWFVTASVATL